MAMSSVQSVSGAIRFGVKRIIRENWVWMKNRTPVKKSLMS